jgi:hypothetical protein
LIKAKTEIELCLGKALFRGLAEPFDRLCLVLLNAQPLIETIAEFKLRFRVPLFSRFSEMLYGGLVSLCLVCFVSRRKFGIPVVA